MPESFHQKTYINQQLQQNIRIQNQLTKISRLSNTNKKHAEMIMGTLLFTIASKKK